MKNWCAIVLLIFLCPTFTFAAIYKHVDALGNVTYTDTPPTDSPNDAPVTLPPLQTYTPKPSQLPGNPPAIPAESNPAEHYQTLVITAPTAEQSIYPGDNNLNLSAAVTPALGQNDVVQWFVDGQPVGAQSAALTQTVTLQDRGSHAVTVEIRAPNGDVLMQSDPVTVNMQKASLLRNQPDNGNFPDNLERFPTVYDPGTLIDRYRNNQGS